MISLSKKDSTLQSLQKGDKKASNQITSLLVQAGLEPTEAAVAAFKLAVDMFTLPVPERTRCVDKRSGENGTYQVRVRHCGVVYCIGSYGTVAEADAVYRGAQKAFNLCDQLDAEYQEFVSKAEPNTNTVKTPQLTEDEVFKSLSYDQASGSWKDRTGKAVNLASYKVPTAA
jgi:hypothetical protein